VQKLNALFAIVFNISRHSKSVFKFCLTTPLDCICGVPAHFDCEVGGVNTLLALSTGVETFYSYCYGANEDLKLIIGDAMTIAFCLFSTLAICFTFSSLIF
jgi:hypothetical protein